MATTTSNSNSNNVKKVTKMANIKKGDIATSSSTTTPPVTIPETTAETITTTETVTPSTSVAEVDVMTSKLGELADKIASISIVMKDAVAITKILQKEYVRICKVHSASISSGRKKKASPSSTVPRKVALGSMSESMAQFLGLSVENQVSRKDVVQGLNLYIKENKLQSPNDGRIIVPDAKLKALLNIEDDVILNYFNMQRYINPHFTVIKGQHQQPADKPVAVA
jgi:upstream activation factor subunit UAF30